MAKYEVTAKEIAALVDVEETSNPKKIVYAFRQLLTKSANFSRYDEFSSRPISEDRKMTDKVLCSGGIKEKWQDLMTWSEKAAHLEDVQHVRDTAMSLLTGNPDCRNLYEQAREIIKSSLLIKEDKKAFYSRILDQPPKSIEQMHETCAAIEQVDQLNDLKCHLQTLIQLYWKASSKASRYYGTAAEKSTVQLYNKLHETKLVPNGMIEEFEISVKQRKTVLLKGVVDAYLKDDIVELKHRTSTYQDVIKPCDYAQMHAYMCIKQKSKCILIESISSQGIVFSKEKVVLWDELFWNSVTSRLGVLVSFADKLSGESLFMKLFFDTTADMQARFLRELLQKVPLCLERIANKQKITEYSNTAAVASDFKSDKQDHGDKNDTQKRCASADIFTKQSKHFKKQ